ncbi:MAG: hypothetical protein IH609_01180 [Dehalococcoidia bacterium]|nr:hypothetical protein [Dehalococcoidia bacterium]
MSTLKIAPAPYTDAPIKPGLPVITLDNKRLGHVKELAGNYFKVDVRFRRDIWLAMEQVAYVDEGCVGMLFRADEAELYRLARPTDDGLQRRFERRAVSPAEGPTDPPWRTQLPFS